MKRKSYKSGRVLWALSFLLATCVLCTWAFYINLSLTLATAPIICVPVVVSVCYLAVTCTKWSCADDISPLPAALHPLLLHPLLLHYLPHFTLTMQETGRALIKPQNTQHLLWTGGEWGKQSFWTGALSYTPTHLWSAWFSRAQFSKYKYNFTCIKHASIYRFLAAHNASLIQSIMWHSSGTLQSQSLLQ